MPGVGRAICLFLLAVGLLAPDATAQEPRRFVNPSDRRVSLDVRETPFREALALLFHVSGVEYVVDPSLPDPPITLRLVEVPFRQALRTFVRVAAAQLPGLTYTGNGILVFRLRKAPPGSPPDEVPPELGEPEVSVLEWFRIPVQYADVAELTRLLEGVLVPSDREARAPGEVWISQLDWRRRGTFPSGNVLYCNLTIYGVRGDNSILVRATQEDVEELKKLVRLLDVPFPQLRVRLAAGELAAAGLTTSGRPLRLTDTAGKDRLQAVVVPRVNGDGTVTLAVRGTLATGGEARPLATRARVGVGEAVTLFILGSGSRALRVRATVTVNR
jgi:hypothetical protein